jgi:arsenite transporter
VPETLARFEYAKVSIPVAILIWAMIFPMMVQIDFAAIVGVRRQPKGLVITTTVNWLIKPFTMFAIAWFFLMVVFAPLIPEDLAREYLAGAILLGAAPAPPWSSSGAISPGATPPTRWCRSRSTTSSCCLPSPPSWSAAGYLGHQRALGHGGLVGAALHRHPAGRRLCSPGCMADQKARHRLVRQRVHEAHRPVTPVGLILTLVLLFAFQGEVILNNPLHIVLIAIPLIIQTVLIFFLAYGWAKAWKVPHNVAAPGAMIGASNFFELAVAAAIALFGLQSGAALATVVGVLVEVPLMLWLVRIANRTRHRLAEEAASLGEVGIESDFRIAVGEPGAEIVRAAKAAGADLLLLGARGHGKVHEFLVGSTALDTARLTILPLWLEPVHEAIVAGNDVLLLATDGSANAAAAEQVMEKLAPRFRRRVAVTACCATENESCEKSDAEDHLATLADRIEGLETRIESADPRDAVVALAGELPADLTVVGKRGRNAMTELLLGSTAEAVCRRVRRPVLLVPARS